MDTSGLGIEVAIHYGEPCHMTVSCLSAGENVKSLKGMEKTFITMNTIHQVQVLSFACLKPGSQYVPLNSAVQLGKPLAATVQTVCHTTASVHKLSILLGVFVCLLRLS